MAKKWVKGAIKHPGALTQKAKAAGMSLGAFESHPPKNVSTKTKRQINLAKTLKSFHHSKKV